MRMRIASAVGLLLVLPGTTGPRDIPLNGTTFVIRALTPVGRGLELGTILDGTVRPDGSACVIDYQNARIVCVTPEGNTAFVFGRKGHGPGEFELPYRVRSGRDGSLVVYDHIGRAVTFVSPDGRLRERRILPVTFSQVNSLVVLDDGRFLVAGRAPNAGAIADSALHLFGPSLDHVRSFGPLPAAKQPSLLNYWGAGALEVIGPNRIAYARSAPADVTVFDSVGRRISGFSVAGVGNESIDAAYDVETRPTSFQIRSRPLPRIGTVIPLPDGSLLVTRNIPRADGGMASYWDVVDSVGRLRGTTRLPDEDLIYPIGIAPSAGTFWCYGFVAGEPVLLRGELVKGASR